MSPEPLARRCQAVVEAWARYRAAPSMESFVELAVSVNSFTEFLRETKNVGLAHASHDLEQAILALFQPELAHPLPEATVNALDGRIQTLCAMVKAQTALAAARFDRRQGVARLPAAATAPRGFLIGHEAERWRALTDQLAHFGAPVRFLTWDEAVPETVAAPLLLLDLRSLPWGEWRARVQGLRARHGLAQIFCLGLRSDFDELYEPLAGGADHCLLEGTPVHALVERILELTQSQEPEPGRVLIVEDSKTASHLIRRTLEENQIACEIVNDPRQALAAVKQFHPDLVLMDMYMPGCTGVELTRLLRQHPEFISVPIVYLSAETDVALQVDAMRLGGDHFLTKPFNPVYLNAVVRTKIERYRALRRTMYHDSLTGLLNHTSGKNTLDLLLESLRAEGGQAAVVMMDIDRFKQVNDTYGHPVGDQVIRSLSWLLKQRLRRGDLLCRYGGEEFLIALPHVDGEQALAIIDRIRDDFSGVRHPAGEGGFYATASAGIALFPHHGTSQALIEAADAALYEAKRTGRNRVCVAP